MSLSNTERCVWAAALARRRARGPGLGLGLGRSPGSPLGCCCTSRYALWQARGGGRAAGQPFGGCADARLGVPCRRRLCSAPQPACQPVSLTLSAYPLLVCLPRCRRLRPRGGRPALHGSTRKSRRGSGAAYAPPLPARLAKRVTGSVQRAKVDLGSHPLPAAGGAPLAGWLDGGCSWAAETTLSPLPMWPILLGLPSASALPLIAAGRRIRLGRSVTRCGRHAGAAWAKPPPRARGQRRGTLRSSRRSRQSR